MADPVYLGAGVTPDDGLSPDQGATLTAFQTGETALRESILGGPLSYATRMMGNFTPSISGDEANQKYGVKGPTPQLSLSWKPDEMVPEGIAQQASETMKDKIQTDFALANRPSTWSGWGAQAGGDLLGTSADPLNIAASFLPVTTIARGAEMAASAARMTETAATMRRTALALQDTLAGRFAGSSLNNAAAVALTQPIILAGSDQMHQDYTFGDAAGNVIMGGILGAGIHGLGEVAGATWRGAMRAAGASLETGDRADLMGQDILAADRSQVIKDLTEQNGMEPSEPEIEAESQARQQQFVDNMRAGKYRGALPAQEPTEGVGMPPEDIAELASQGRFGEAAEAMKSHISELENDPDLNMTPEEKEQANEPVSTFNKIKGLMDDFTSCVAEESA